MDLQDGTVDGLKTLLLDHQQTFASSSADLGFVRCWKIIDTGDARRSKQSPCRPPISASDAEDEILDEMLNTGVIEPSHSTWASPANLVKRKYVTFRFCIDYGIN